MDLKRQSAQEVESCCQPNWGCSELSEGDQLTQSTFTSCCLWWGHPGWIPFLLRFLSVLWFSKQNSEALPGWHLINKQTKKKKPQPTNKTATIKIKHCRNKEFWIFSSPSLKKPKHLDWISVVENYYDDSELLRTAKVLMSRSLGVLPLTSLNTDVLHGRWIKL